MSQPSKTSDRFIRHSAMVAAIACAFIGSAHAAFITDGDFESPPLAPFTSVDRPVVTGVTFIGDAGIQNNGSAGGVTVTLPNPNQYGFVRNYSDSLQSGAPGSITFAVTGLTAGSIYQVAFLAAQRSADFPFVVSFDGTPIATDTPTITDAFQSFTTSFTATRSSGSLGFAGFYTINSASGFTAFDNVVITARDLPPGGPTRVPEPAPIALLGLGVVAGIVARQRSRAATAA